MVLLIRGFVCLERVRGGGGRVRRKAIMGMVASVERTQDMLFVFVGGCVRVVFLERVC